MEADGMKTGAAKKEEEMQKWKEQIEAQQSSGMTVRKWCAENGIDPNTYYYRMRKVRERKAVFASTIVPIALQKQEARIHIEKNGMQIVLPANVATEVLIALVHELC